MPEIVSINQADQFVGDHTAYACGFFAVMMCASMSPPDQAATKSPSQISNDALAAYARYNGSNSASNSAGMSLPQLYSLLHEVGLHYQGTVLDLAHIRAWLLSGFPVIVAVAETCVHDLDLGDRVPYPWNPSGNHVIVLTGLDGDNVLARDSANIAPPNTLRPGPRRYDAQMLAAGLVSATAIVPPWRARPGGDIDPTSGWEADNWPMEAERHVNQLEYSNPTLGAGQQQVFRKCVLEYLPKENRIVHMWVGQEIIALRGKTEVSADLSSQLTTLLRTLQPLSSACATIESILKEGK